MTLRLRLILGAGVLAVVFAAGCSSGKADKNDQSSATTASTAEPQPLPEPRTEVVGVALRDSIVAVGGINPDGSASTRADEWVASENRWRRLPSMPTGRHHAAAAVVGERVYVIAGYTNERGGPWEELDDVISLRPGDTEWKIEPSLPAPRGAPAAGAVGRTVVVFGGVSGGQVVGSSDVWSTGDSTWRAGPPLAQVREHTAAAAAGGRVYAIAGRVASLESNLRSVESLDPADLASGWRREPDLNDTRGGTAGAAAGDVPCVAGGEEPADTIASVECLRDGAWQRVAQLREPRHGVAVAFLNGRLHVIAGGDKPGATYTGTHEAIEITS